MIHTLIGNPLAKKALLQMAAHHTVPSTLLFYGTNGVGKSQFAFALAELLIGKKHSPKLLSGNHPDLHVYMTEGKSAQHPVEKMREMIHEVALPAFEAPAKVFILHDAHQMHAFSANALLKTLEEPPADTYFILLTDEIDAMLPTIVSRCRKVPFFPIPRAEIEVFAQEKWKKKPEEARRIAFLSHGSLAKAEALALHAEQPMRKLVLEILTLDPLRDYPQLLKQLTHLQESIEEKEESTLPQTDVLFEEILAWYRDLHLLKTNKAPEFLYHLDQLDALRLSAARSIPPLERVLEESLTARLALQRSIKLRTVLEHFLLSLNDF